jgi:hypothetical protein
MLLLVLDLAGAFVFALDGGLTALRATRLDIVGVVTLAMITALGAASCATSSSARYHRPPSTTGATSRWRRQAAWSPSPSPACRIG